MKILLIILCIIVIMMLYCYSESLHFKVTAYTVDAQELAGKSIVLVSDLHCKSYGKNNMRLLKAIAKADPDAVVISGDLINGKHHSEFEYAYSFLRLLKAMKVPVYYAFGNHETRIIRYQGMPAYSEYVNQVKKFCILLNNTCSVLGDASFYGLELGPEYFRGKGDSILSPSIRSYINRASADRYNILIAHDPSFINEYSDWGADLVLSGHLHGGIIRLPFVGGIISPRCELFPKHDKGMFRYRNSVMIVSGGLGWHGIPFRFMNIPELIKINFSEVHNESSSQTRSI